jgi:hypothetical protein
MPAWVEPQLATLTRQRFSGPDWLFERKLDGERCLAFASEADVRLMSRSRHEITGTFPEIVPALAAQRSADFVVDGGLPGVLLRVRPAVRRRPRRALDRQPRRWPGSVPRKAKRCRWRRDLITEI